MFFYELHEGDNEVYSDVLLAHESEYEPQEFFELVQSIRHRLKDGFNDDTLIEAIAAELERDHDFVFVSDDKLTAAVNVSRVDEDNFLADVAAEDDTEPEEGDATVDADFLTVYAELDPTDAGTGTNN